MKLAKGDILFGTPRQIYRIMASILGFRLFQGLQGVGIYVKASFLTGCIHYAPVPILITSVLRKRELDSLIITQKKLPTIRLTKHLIISNNEQVKWGK